jgi:molecular chaperone GrpE
MSGEENRAAGDAADEAEEAAGESVESEKLSAAAEPVTLSYAEYEELRTLAKERDDYLKRLQRAVADYQNLQKRIDRFRESAREAALRSLAEEVLPMADSLGRALEAARQAEGAENIVEGLLLVEKELYGALGKFGIRPVEAVRPSLPRGGHAGGSRGHAGEHGCPRAEERLRHGRHRHPPEPGRGDGRAQRCPVA